MSDAIYPDQPAIRVLAVSYAAAKNSFALVTKPAARPTTNPSQVISGLPLSPGQMLAEWMIRALPSKLL